MLAPGVARRWTLAGADENLVATKRSGPMQPNVRQVRPRSQGLAKRRRRMQINPTDSTRVYINVPYAEKDEAKLYGARWDPERRLWWIDRQKIAEHPGVARWMNSTSASHTPSAGTHA